jgi:broad specificity phosphatase PhoE
VETEDTGRGLADRIFIVRHGETEWSASGRHTSRTDLPLTETGRRQASQLVDGLSQERFELVLCSPLLRARQTCELAGFAEVAELCDDLHEWDYGRYEGLTTPQIRSENPDWILWRDGCPDGETPPEIGGRVDRVLEQMSGVSGDGLAFAHGHVLRVLTARWLEMEPAAGKRFKLAAAGLSILGHEHDNSVIERWNAAG